MPILGYILLFCLASSVGAILLVSSFLLLPEGPRQRATAWLIVYAIGLLLAAALLDLLPAALAMRGTRGVFATVLGTLVALFLLERLILGHHFRQHGDVERNVAGPLLLLGDGLHNFIDGGIIAAAFLTSIPLGISTGIAVFLHETFHEGGDLAILVSSGYTRRQALFFNLLSSLTTFIGALLTYAALEVALAAQAYLLACAAASFLYIALADLLPLLPRQPSIRTVAGQVLGLLAGIGTLLGLGAWLGG